MCSPRSCTRERTGRGQHVEVNLLSSAVAILANQASSYLATGTAPRRLGNHHPSIAPYGAFRARDGLLAIAVGNDRQWAVLAEAHRRRPSSPATRASPRTPPGSSTATN